MFKSGISSLKSRSGDRPVHCPKICWNWRAGNASLSTGTMTGLPELTWGRGTLKRFTPANMNSDTWTFQARCMRLHHCYNVEWNDVCDHVVGGVGWTIEQRLSYINKIIKIIILEIYLIFSWFHKLIMIASGLSILSNMEVEGCHICCSTNFRQISPLGLNKMNIIWYCYNKVVILQYPSNKCTNYYPSINEYCGKGL